MTSVAASLGCAWYEASVTVSTCSSISSAAPPPPCSAPGAPTVAASTARRSVGEPGGVRSATAPPIAARTSSVRTRARVEKTRPGASVGSVGRRDQTAHPPTASTLSDRVADSSVGKDEGKPSEVNVGGTRRAMGASDDGDGADSSEDASVSAAGGVAASGISSFVSNGTAALSGVRGGSGSDISSSGAGGGGEGGGSGACTAGE